MEERAELVYSRHMLRVCTISCLTIICARPPVPSQMEACSLLEGREDIPLVKISSDNLIAASATSASGTLSKTSKLSGFYLSVACTAPRTIASIPYRITPCRY